jgi:predicted NBD/HSP70 family sugar kinase
MYLGIDVGGTKTLIAALDDNGIITEKHRFPTPKEYDSFLIQVENTVDLLSTKDFWACGIGVPAVSLDRKNGIAHRFGNLAWQDVPILTDIQKIVGCPVSLENDAKLAGLSESRLRPDVNRLLFITISTGIGFSLIVNGVIDSNIGDGGGRLMLQPHKDKLMPWEDFASGKAIVSTYGKMAKDITDESIWEKISLDLSGGLLELIALTEPNLIVIGGSIGEYADRFIEPLTTELKRYETPLLTIPPIEGAKRVDDAVVYGCYDYCIATFGKHR